METAEMGRVVTDVTIENAGDLWAVRNGLKSVDQVRRVTVTDALVDTGASFMALPFAWRDRLGDLETMTEVEMETATQETIKAEVCGPVRIQIEGFRPIHTEVSFVDMKPQDGEYEPLIGYLVLEQSQAGVDILGHRLVKIKHMDLK